MTTKIMWKTTNVYAISQNVWIQFIEDYGKSHLTNQNKMSKICYFFVLLESKGYHRPENTTPYCAQNKANLNFRSVSLNNWFYVSWIKGTLEEGRVDCHRWMIKKKNHTQCFVNYGWKKVITLVLGLQLQSLK